MVFFVDSVHSLQREDWLVNLSVFFSNRSPWGVGITVSPYDGVGISQGWKLEVHVRRNQARAVMMYRIVNELIAIPASL